MQDHVSDNEIIEALRVQLKQVTKDYDNYAYIISHDLKAPLRAISNLTEWIKEDLGNEAEAEVLKNFDLLKSRVDKMNKMMDALTVFSRVGRYEVEKSEFELNHLLFNIKEELENDFDKLKVTLEIADQLHLCSYKEKLNFVLVEIIKNAALHNNDAIVEVIVKVTDSKDKLTIVITDNGHGVSLVNDQIGNLSNLFFTELPKEKSNAVGAGLAICKKIIQFINGEFSIEKNIPQGLKIIINWPKT